MLSLDLNSEQLQQGGGSGRAGLALGLCWAAVPYFHFQLCLGAGWFGQAGGVERREAQWVCRSGPFFAYADSRGSVLVGSLLPFRREVVILTCLHLPGVCTTTSSPGWGR